MVPRYERTDNAGRYDARIAAHTRQIKPFSVHKLLHLMIRQSKVTAADAAAFAAALSRARRAPDYTAAELTSGALGRVGKP